MTLTLIPVFAYLTLLYRENLLSLFKEAHRRKVRRKPAKIRKKRIFRRVCFCLCTHLHHHVCGKLCDAPPAAHGIPADDCRRVTVSDIFPVLGPGTVLLPLAVYRLLCGSAAQALGLFIGWIILSVIRQIIEPKLLAKMTRTPPAVMLFAVYCSLISRNFWLIPYTGTFFMLIGMLKKAGILTVKIQNQI